MALSQWSESKEDLADDEAEEKEDEEEIKQIKEDERDFLKNEEVNESKIEKEGEKQEIEDDTQMKAAKKLEEMRK